MYLKHFVMVLYVALTVAQPSASTAQVLTRSGYVTQLTGCCVVTADFNHDGILDLAVATFQGDFGVQVFLGKGDGTFGLPQSYAPGSGTDALATADLNHDGNADIVVANFTGGFVTVLLGKGDGTFQPPITYATGYPAAVAIGDFNNDGNLDIATTDQSPSCSCVAVLLGNGDGTFQEPAIVTYMPIGGGPEALAASNFNQDENLDLAVTIGYISSDAALILLGNGDGTFTLGESYTLDPSSDSIAVADLRHNGNTDLVVAALESPGPAVLLGNGDGTFQLPAYYDFGHNASSTNVAVGDMNGDGVPDLVALPNIIGENGANYSAVYIFPGKGDGTFGRPDASYPAEFNSFPRGTALADFNGDGQLDITYADSFGSRDGVNEYVLLNTGTVNFSPVEPLAFANQKHGTTSPPQKVTLTNQGKVKLAISSIKTTGEFGATSTCGKTVAPKASCTISVTFSPKTSGELAGTVEINDSASSKPQVITMSGKAY